MPRCGRSHAASFVGWRSRLADRLMRPADAIANLTTQRIRTLLLRCVSVLDGTTTRCR